MFRFLLLSKQLTSEVIKAMFPSKWLLLGFFS